MHNNPHRSFWFSSVAVVQRMECSWYCELGLHIKQILLEWHVTKVQQSALRWTLTFFNDWIRILTKYGMDIISLNGIQFQCESSNIYLDLGTSIYLSWIIWSSVLSPFVLKLCFQRRVQAVDQEEYFSKVVYTKMSF